MIYYNAQATKFSPKKELNIKKLKITEIISHKFPKLEINIRYKKYIRN